MIARLRDVALRVAATLGHRLLTLGRRSARPGAHAIALTSGGEIVLVRLRYAPGWRLPGGGRHPDEKPEDAVLRELQEEIGMTAHGKVRPVRAELIVVADVRYAAPRWSWEIEHVAQWPLDRLPEDMSPRMKVWLEEVRTELPG